jgi:hypothetical protein
VRTIVVDLSNIAASNAHIAFYVIHLPFNVISTKTYDCEIGNANRTNTMTDASSRKQILCDTPSLASGHSTMEYKGIEKLQSKSTKQDRMVHRTRIFVRYDNFPYTISFHTTGRMLRPSFGIAMVAPLY